MPEPLLLVVGSVNYDLIFSHRLLPAAGETLTGATFHESCGGKGANQAVAAARCARHRERFPIRVAFAGAIGADSFGAEQRRIFEQDGVDVGHLRILDDAHTGISSIWVEAADGQNRILNSPGANSRYLPTMVDRLPIEEASLVLVQNEIPRATLGAVVERAAAARIPVIWNPAPFGAGEEVALDPRGLRFITPNEVEAAAILGQPVAVDRPQVAVEALAERGFAGVVLTLGRVGVALGDGGRRVSIPAPEVEAIDTTGAGDAFNGAFAAALVAGFEIEEAARFGVDYASASVTRPGTQSALPRDLPPGW